MLLIFKMDLSIEDTAFTSTNVHGPRQNLLVPAVPIHPGVNPPSATAKSTGTVYTNLQASDRYFDLTTFQWNPADGFGKDIYTFINSPEEIEKLLVKHIPSFSLYRFWKTDVSLLVTFTSNATYQGRLFLVHTQDVVPPTDHFGSNSEIYHFTPPETPIADRKILTIKDNIINICLQNNAVIYAPGDNGDFTFDMPFDEFLPMYSRGGSSDKALKKRISSFFQVIVLDSLQTTAPNKSILAKVKIAFKNFAPFYME